MLKEKPKEDQTSQAGPFTDHRDIGRELDLFSFHEVAPGAVFWHPKGMIIFREFEKLTREINDREGYEEISTPIMTKKEVFEKSGHWDFFRDNMFWFQNNRDENETLILKPMNCPESTYIYNSKIRSYKDLPLRLAELGRLHRNELSGTLGGLFRVRQITMDDAHIFIRQDQTEQELIRVIKIIKQFYEMFNFKSEYVLATRPKDALGNKEQWDLAEKALHAALEKSALKFEIAEGEGAFYGPKIEVHIRDSQNRDWQLGTAQLDLVMLPERFNLSYIDENGQKQKPWVIHRAIFGSFERFIGILLEHTGGALPLWLSPIQAAILPIGEKQADYAKSVFEELKKQNIRVQFDDPSETISKRIREAELQKIPYIIIAGEKEKKNNNISVRQRSVGDLGVMQIHEILEKIQKEITNRI